MEKENINEEFDIVEFDDLTGREETVSITDA